MKTRKVFLRYLLLVLLLLVFVLAGVGYAQSQTPIVIKFANLAGPNPLDPEPNTPTLPVFKHVVENLTQGRVKVELYPAGQLGDERSLLEQCLRGEIEIIDIGMGIVATTLNCPEYGIFEIPYLFKSMEVAFRLLDSKNPFTAKLMEDIRKKTGLRPLMWTPVGFRHLTNNVRLVKGPEDMRGIKIRVQPIESFQHMMSALGAQPVPISWLELYTSLQTGVVDGQENPLSNILSGNFFEVQKYLTLTGHVMFASNAMANDKWFRSLPEDIQLAIIEAFETTRKATTGAVLIHESQALDRLKKAGMQVYAPSPQELERFREKAQPAVLDLLKKRGVNEKFINDLLSEIKKIEGELGYSKRM